MLSQLLSLMLVQAAPIVIPAPNRIPRPAAAPTGAESMDVRITSPEGVLWQGRLRVAPNQSASYQENLNQAAAGVCPPGTPDRSERRQLNFSIYQQSYQATPSFRLDVSWVRPVPEAGCGETGTRTVQINQMVVLEHGESTSVSGDAGLRVEITRR